LSEAATIHLLVAGDPGQLTGGYRYDARIVEGLRALGRIVCVHGLPGRFPLADDTARQSLARTLAGLADDTTVVLDGLAANGLPDVLMQHAGRLRLIGLIHHPLADETGLDTTTRAALLQAESRAIEVLDHVVVTSVFTADRLSALGMGGPERTVIEPGVARPALGERGETDCCQLLCVASITPRKGHDVLIEALAEITDLDWHCRLVGSMTHAADWAVSIERLIADRALESRISLDGALADEALARAYTQADLFVLASHYEGYGMVVTEAIAHGLPVVTTTGGALACTLPDGCGIAVAPGDAPALAGALRRLIASPERLESCAQGARSARANLNHWSDAARDFAAVLERNHRGVFS